MKTPFPPIPWLWRDYKRAGAWYGGDPARLRACAGPNSFWKSDEEFRVHVPVAADIAAMSAALIFASSPEIRCADEKTQQRINLIMERAGVYSVLLQAAELASVYGGVFLKWSWNRSDGFPRLTAVPADCGLPVWRDGRVVEIRLWNLVRREDGRCWRTEETYTPDGRIYTRLLRGTAEELGERVPLSSLAETRDIPPVSCCGDHVMLCQYVPNLLPNRHAPHTRFGRSDFDSLYSLFDALDEAYSAIQRETRMTKTTVIVPAEYLRRSGELFGDGEWVYANHSGAFTALDIDSDRASSPITVVNPDLQAESRIAVCRELIRRIFSLAGFAPQSAGMDESASAESGAAISLRERKSLRTAEAKKTHWWHALNELVRTMIRLDAAVYHAGSKPDAPFSVELRDSARPDPASLAQLAASLRGVASRETIVSLIHPDWSEEERKREVERIREEIS